MQKRALIVGIDEYDNVNSLAGCVNDALEMKAVLERHEDGSKNYDCKILTSDSIRVTRKLLRHQWTELFENFTGDILFYFSGHGTPTDVGGYLVTQDAETDDPGLSMNDLLSLANSSKANSVLLILDCCFSGSLGNPSSLNNSIENQAQLREGVTILTASRSNQVATEVGGQGVFTNLVLGALRGGGADVRGRVSAASVYAYAEQALGAWDQRPMYKSHANSLEPVRFCKPCVSDELLRELPVLFDSEDFNFYLDPSFEYTHATAKIENIEIFDKFKVLRNARLLTTYDNKDLYFIALDSEYVSLTPLGQFYWNLAKNGKI